MAWLILALIALYPCELSESEIELPPRPRASPPVTRPPQDPKKSKFAPRGYSRVDRRKFLGKFERQAGSQLVPCVQETWGRKGSVTFIGRLHSNGRMTGVRLLSNQGALDCAITAVQAMRFEQAASSLTDESVEVTWRFDW